MAELTKLTKSRDRVKAKLTNFSNFLALLEDEPEKSVELISRSERAESLWVEFELFQDQIEDLDDSEAQAQQRIDFEDAYHAMISKARKLSAQNQPSTTPLKIFNPPIFNPHAINQQIFAMHEQGAVRSVVKLLNIAKI